MNRRAFTAVEALLSIGVIAVTAGISIPLLRNYQVRNDLNVGKEYMLQALRTAQSNARAGKNTGTWGVAVAEGVVFEGHSYAERVEASDEAYPLPPTIRWDGLSEVVFERVTGRPQPTGEIIATGSNGDQFIITIGDQGLIAATGLAAEGETTAGGGEGVSSSRRARSSSSQEEDEESSEESSESSESSDGEESSDAAASEGAGQSGSQDGQAGSEGSQASAASQGGTVGGQQSSAVSSESSAVSSSSAGSLGASCEDRFVVDIDGTVRTTGRVTMTAKALGSDITYGAGGPEIQVTAQYSQDGRTWSNLFNGFDIDGGEEQVVSGLASGTRVSFKVTGEYSSFFRRSYVSNDSTGHVEVLRNGDRLPDYPVFGNQANLEQFLRNIVDSRGRIAIGQYDAVLLVELGDLNTSSADFQDAVILVKFDQEVGSCAVTVSSSAGVSSSAAATSSVPPSSAASAAPARFKVVFDRLVNSGNGNAAKKVFVGPQSTQYAESAWIPLSQNGAPLTDASLVETVAGLAAQRGNGWLRIMNHGTLSTGKEIVDARIVFENVLVAGIGNDASNPTEKMSDGKTSDNADGDEATVSDDDSYVTFITRTTGDDDGIYIYFVDSVSSDATELKKARGGSKKKIDICHFTGASGYSTLSVPERAAAAHLAHGDHMGSCESDDDDDLIPNYLDLCPDTDVEQPGKYLLFERNNLTDVSSIFREGPQKKISEFDLEDTMGCSCSQLLDVAEGKTGYYFTNLPRLYLQLRSLLDFYVSTARKFGCSRDLLRSVQRNRN